MNAKKISTLFIDVGGVLLTNGWDRHSRKKAAEHFKIDYDEMDSRHHLAFDTFEVGKSSLEDYLSKIVFNIPRSFTPNDFIEFMYSQSESYPDMINYVRELKKKHHLKVVVVSNEGRELTNYRIKKFGLNEFVDFFIASSFVHLRKPDKDIYRLALDVAQTPPEQVIYIDDRPMFVEVGSSFGIHGVRHVDQKSTAREIEKFLK